MTPHQGNRINRESILDGFCGVVVLLHVGSDDQARRFTGASAASGAGDAFVSRVRKQFADLDAHVPTLAEVARALAVSERTLRRRLREYGTSYSELLQEVRRNSALTALVYSSLTVDQIAAQLGYTETTNFRHAFRRWLGDSPHAFRQRARSCTHDRTDSRAA